jgi:hypothetical protein
MGIVNEIVLSLSLVLALCAEDAVGFGTLQDRLTSVGGQIRGHGRGSEGSCFLMGFLGVVISY